MQPITLLVRSRIAAIPVTLSDLQDYIFLLSIVRSTSVCLSVCLSVREEILRKDTRDLYQICVRMLLMAVARSSSGKVTTSQENGHFGGFSSTLTMHYTA